MNAVLTFNVPHDLFEDVKYIEARIQWSKFCSQYFEMHYFEWNWLNFG